MYCMKEQESTNVNGNDAIGAPVKVRVLVMNFVSALQRVICGDWRQASTEDVFGWSKPTAETFEVSLTAGVGLRMNWF